MSCAEARGFEPRKGANPNRLAARIAAVPIDSSWTNVLDRSSLDGIAHERTATQTATLLPGPLAERVAVKASRRRVVQRDSG